MSVGESGCLREAVSVCQSEEEEEKQVKESCSFPPSTVSAAPGDARCRVLVVVSISLYVFFFSFFFL